MNAWVGVAALGLLAQAARGAAVTVVTWNLQWFPGGEKWRYDAGLAAHQIEQVQTALARLQPDILFLQEVRDEAAANLAIARCPALRVHTVSAFRHPNGQPTFQQMAIASRFPALASWSEPWHKGWADAPRGFAFTLLDLQGAKVLLYTLHLKSNLGEALANTNQREDATAQWLEHLAALDRQHAPAGVILGGDFNTSPDLEAQHGEQTFRLLRRAGFDWCFEGIPLARRVTIYGLGRYPDACFDHILSRGFERVRVQVDRLARGSDHLPVQVTLRRAP
jgi:endonuclease/exonuclease/phosphatase family metal-dependent hydrolase